MLARTADCYDSAMIGIKEIRRLKLIEMLKEYESIEEFCKSPIASKLNISAGYVVQLKNGTSKIGDKTALKLEAIGGKTKYWLDQQLAVNEPSEEYITTQGTRRMNTEVKIKTYRIPLISWSDAISWPDLDEKERGKLVDMEVITSQMTSADAYALEVLNDDYTNPPGQLSIQRGERLIVDPLMEPQHGHIVIAKFKDQELPTPMVYQIVAGRKYLKPIKTEYPPIPLDDSVILRGTVVCGEKNYLGT